MDKTSLASISNPEVTAEVVRAHLSTVMDPELNVDIVSLGLIYDVTVLPQAPGSSSAYLVHILLTLTTPGCPLAAVFEPMIKESLRPIADLDPDQDVRIELTFDPPWVPDMMSEEARAELGFD